MIADMNETYVNSLITSLGETFPPISGRQKNTGDERDQARSFSVVSAADDKVELSPEAQYKAEQKQNAGLTGQPEELSTEEKQEVRELKETDRKVRAHEQAHVAAGGNLVKRGASFEFTSGPDGHRYAVAGEVTIDTSEVEGDPQATILKAAHIRRAALAPADPSAQDRAVAAEAATMAYRARMELHAQNNKTNKKSQPESLHIDLFA